MHAITGCSGDDEVSNITRPAGSPTPRPWCRSRSTRRSSIVTRCGCCGASVYWRHFRARIKLKYQLVLLFWGNKTNNKTNWIFSFSTKCFNKVPSLYSNDAHGITRHDYPSLTYLSLRDMSNWEGCGHHTVIMLTGPAVLKTCAARLILVWSTVTVLLFPIL